MATRNPAGMPRIHYDAGKALHYTKVSYTDQAGTQRRKSLYGKNPKEVAAKIKDFTRNKDAGLIMDADKMSLGQWLTQWLKTYKKPSLEVTSYAAYEHQVNQHIIPEMGAIPLKKLQRIRIQEFFNQKGADLSPSTLELIKAILGNALRMAVVDGYIVKSPAVAIKLPAVRSKDVKPLDKEEIGKLLEAAKGQRLYSMIYLAIHTGMRKGELAGLRWQDVDLKKGIVNVRQGVKHDRKNKIYIIGSTKTETAVRSIPINTSAIAELRRHKARQAQERLNFGEAYEETTVWYLPSRAV